MTQHYFTVVLYYRFPMCGEECRVGPVHARECEILSRCGDVEERTDLDKEDRVTYSAVFILRLNQNTCTVLSPPRWKKANLFTCSEASMSRDGSFIFFFQNNIP